MHDIIIVGAGPAGMAAAIYAANLGQRVLVLQSSSSIRSSDDQGIRGGALGWEGQDLPALRNNFYRLVRKIDGNPILKIARVVSLERHVSTFCAQEVSGQCHYARSAIICSGRPPIWLGHPGEKTCFGDGLFACGYYDREACRGLNVAVVGGGSAALKTMLSLSGSASRLYSINPHSRFYGPDPLQNRILSLPGINYFPGAKISRFGREGSTVSVELQLAGKNLRLDCGAVFVEYEWQAPAPFERLTRRTSSGQIMVAGDMNTGVPGLYAAGAAVGSEAVPALVAAGQGASAAISAVNFLSSQP